MWYSLWVPVGMFWISKRGKEVLRETRGWERCHSKDLSHLIFVISSVKFRAKPSKNSLQKQFCKLLSVLVSKDTWLKKAHVKDGSTYWRKLAELLLRHLTNCSTKESIFKGTFVKAVTSFVIIQTKQEDFFHAKACTLGSWGAGKGEGGAKVNQNAKLDSHACAHLLSNQNSTTNQPHGRAKHTMLWSKQNYFDTVQGHRLLWFSSFPLIWGSSVTHLAKSKQIQRDLLPSPRPLGNSFCESCRVLA